MKNKLLLLLFAMLISCFAAFAQTEEEVNPIDTLIHKMEAVESQLSLMKKLKFSGYLQMQYQKADTIGIETMTGDKFGAGIDQRIALRRGRLKATYKERLTEGAIQLDVNKDDIHIKEAYLKFTEPWLETVSLQTGLFNRPFGFELPFSSASMEAPERTGMIQNLFPGETDFGAALVIRAPKTHALNVLKLEAGFFNGTSNKLDFDNYKDFIAHLTFSETYLNEGLKLGLGASYYNGKMGNPAITYSTWNDSVFKSNAIDTLGGIKREYFGLDGQVTFETPIGYTTFRAEYIWGEQPGLATTAKTPVEVSATSGSVYVRPFQGGYLYFVQSIGMSKHKLVAKYDWYDPNTLVEGKEIVAQTAAGTNTRLNKADIAYTTLGVGWIYHWDANLRITAYYDMVTNEETGIKGYKTDANDNVFTLRLQYRF